MLKCEEFSNFVVSVVYINLLIGLPSIVYSMYVVPRIAYSLSFLWYIYWKHYIDYLKPLNCSNAVLSGYIINLCRFILLSYVIDYSQWIIV